VSIKEFSKSKKRSKSKFRSDGAGQKNVQTNVDTNFPLQILVKQYLRRCLTSLTTLNLCQVMVTEDQCRW